MELVVNSWAYFLGGGGAKAALKTSRIRKKVLMAIVRCDKATLEIGRAHV